MPVVDRAREVVRLGREEELTFKAAGIAFYAVTSLIPLLIISVAVLSAFGVTEALNTAIRSVLPESVGSAVLEILAQTDAHGVAGVVGVGFTLWSATKIFRGLSVAFVELYPGDPDRSLVTELQKSLVVIGVLLFGVAILSLVDPALARLPDYVPGPRFLGSTFAFLFLAVALFPLYYVMPPRERSVPHALPGTLIAALGWVLLQFGFSLYVENAGNYAAYGLLGVVLILVTFLYFAAIVLLVGAAVNVVLDR